MIIVQPLIALIAAILILIVPRLLNYIVAIYLILAGISGLCHIFSAERFRCGHASLNFQ